MKSTLITGGARSGKSRYAQEMAQATGDDVLFVATAEAGDAEMKRRIKAHRRSRPPSWKTIEVPTGVGRKISKSIGKAKAVIIDCITLLVNNIMEQHGEDDAEKTEKAVTAEIKELLGYIDRLDAHFIIVTNEVGLGIVPGDRTSRHYRDLLGKTNQMLAQYADEVILMVAGLPVKIKSSERR